MKKEEILNVNELFKRLEILRKDEEGNKKLIKELKNEIIEISMPFARSIADEYYKNNYFDYEDVESYAYEGLINAVNHYMLDSNADFYYYAYTCIAHTITNGTNPKYGFTYNITNMFKEAQNEAQIIFGRKYVPGDDEMLKEILNILREKQGLSEKELARIFNMEMINKTFYNNDIDVQKVYVVEPSQDNDMLFSLVKRNLSKKLSKLSPLRKVVIMKRYGFYGDEYSYDDIAKELNISYVSVKQALYRGLRNLRSFKYNEINNLLAEMNDYIEYGYDDENVKVYK